MSEFIKEKRYIVVPVEFGYVFNKEGRENTVLKYNVKDNQINGYLLCKFGRRLHTLKLLHGQGVRNGVLMHIKKVHPSVKTNLVAFPPTTIDL